MHFDLAGMTVSEITNWSVIAENLRIADLSTRVQRGAGRRSKGLASARHG